MAESNCPWASPRFAVVFDVESVGLHGEAFAAAWVVVDISTQIEVEAGLHVCESVLASGEESDRKWVRENVPVLPVNCDDPPEVRTRFWTTWLRWREQGAWLVANCTWPVETNFLSACVRDIGPAAKFQGPYPLIDIASFAVLMGIDPTKHVERLPDELPLHHPLADARCAARLLLEYLHKRTVVKPSSE